MSFITKTTKLVPKEVLECSLPDVLKIWATGSLSMAGVPPEANYPINLLFTDQKLEQFTDPDPQKAWIKAETWCKEYHEKNSQNASV
jgi:hypothetical protein